MIFTKTTSLALFGLCVNNCFDFDINNSHLEKFVCFKSECNKKIQTNLWKLKVHMQLLLPFFERKMKAFEVGIERVLIEGLKEEC